MAFISLADELTKKSATCVENKFITKYLAELEPVAVKVYLYALYLAQSGQTSYTLYDLATKLLLTEEQAKSRFEFLEECELVSITSYSPFEIKILECENYYGKPKKLHPEKYEGLYEELQSVISGRMISQDEFRDYLILLEDYGFERNAIVMIVNYCADLKGDNIGAAYIKKVAKNFHAEGVVTAKQVEEKLSSYTTSTASLIKIFTAISIKRRPEVEDGDYLTKWLNMGFNEEAIICAAKNFKLKSMDKLDTALQELYKNKKFDCKEIEDYKKSKASLYDTAFAIGKALGVYISDATPYVENYVSGWFGLGFTANTLKLVASYCFLSGKNNFDLMNDFVANLYNEAYVDEASVEKLLDELAEDDKFIKKVLSACGLTRKIISYDRQALARWRNWGFNDVMILKAAELSCGKNNPVAAMNYLLSQWKNGGIFTVDSIPTLTATGKQSAKRSVTAEWQTTIQKLNSTGNEK